MTKRIGAFALEPPRIQMPGDTIPRVSCKTPFGSKLLTIAIDATTNIVAFIEYEHPDDNDQVENVSSWEFLLIGVGKSVPLGHDYVTTLYNGPNVMHVYQKRMSAIMT